MRGNGEVADPDSPSIKRTSKLFSGKRSVDIATHKGLKIKAESYKNLHVKNPTAGKKETVRVEMQVKSEVDGSIMPLPNSFLNKQLV